MKSLLSDRLCACGCGQFTRIATQTNRYGQKGEPNAYVHSHTAKGHGRPRQETVKRYRTVRNGKENQLLHRVRAEKALGKSLPLGAIVHHADGTKGDNAPLVICPDDAYHMLLHRRMRIKAAGGNPNTDLICTKCQQVKHQMDFHVKRTTYRGFSQWCKACYSDYSRAYLLRKKAM